MSDRRLATLSAALGFLQLPPRAPELQLLHRWLDSWRGVGDIVGWLGIVAGAAVFVAALAVPLDDPALVMALMLALRGGRLVADS